MEVRSPLTNSTNVALEREIRCDFVIESYFDQLRIDVTTYFQGLERIGLYRCLDTDYRFYYPSGLEGDAQFYEALQKFPWYYMDWKWEHEIASRIIEPHSRVLEIGCGRGGFLERLQAKGMECVGLELNPNAAERGRSKGVRIIQETIENHAEKNANIYDAVCVFQVLEHISDVQLFLRASLSVLKPGGRLIIGVPNNSYCEYDSIFLKENILDMPPHHMGLWSNVALANLQKIFPIHLEQMVAEPAQAWHVPSYRGLIRDRLATKFGLAGRVYYYLIRQILIGALKDLAVYLPGHTIVASYRYRSS